MIEKNNKSAYDFNMKKNNDALTSVKVTFPDKNIQKIITSEMTLSTTNDISYLRGVSFFTSGITIKKDKQYSLWMLSEHYQRLMLSYTNMYETNTYPFSESDFEKWIDLSINANKNKPLYIIVVLHGGQAIPEFIDKESYCSGFTTDTIKEMNIIVHPYKNNFPQWSYSQGINVMTIPYQRPFADTKSTFYVGGIKARQTINAINTQVLYQIKKNNLKDKKSISNYMTVALTQYNRLSSSEKKSYKKHWLSCENIELKNNKTTSRNKSALSRSTYQQLIHEPLYVHPDNHDLILEGPTFGLLGINERSQIVFPVLKLSKEAYKINNDGKILESITALGLLKVIQKYNIPYVIQSLSVKQLNTFQCLFVISAKRTIMNKNELLLMPIKTINNTPLMCNYDNKTYIDLKKAMKTYLSASTDINH